MLATPVSRLVPFFPRFKSRMRIGFRTMRSGAVPSLALQCTAGGRLQGGVSDDRRERGGQDLNKS